MRKTILITGAGTGIGKDSAFELTRRGHKVIATTETEEQALTLRAEAAKENLILEVLKLDITASEDRALVQNYELDVLINNAGMGETGSLAEIPMDRVRRNFEVNVFSTIEMIQVALPAMMKKKRGTILVVSSVAGRIPSPFLNPYSMTKYALSGGMAALRGEIHQIAKNVHISLIEPGAYGTGFNQRMFAKKYEWMGEASYFAERIAGLKNQEQKLFSMIEQKSTKSIVRKIVQAAESRKPRLRYVAPFSQGLFVRMLRIFGA